MFIAASDTAPCIWEGCSKVLTGYRGLNVRLVPLLVFRLRLWKQSGNRSIGECKENQDRQAEDGAPEVLSGG